MMLVRLPGLMRTQRPRPWSAPLLVSTAHERVSMSHALLALCVTYPRRALCHANVLLACRVSSRMPRHSRHVSWLNSCQPWLCSSSTRHGPPTMSYALRFKGLTTVLSSNLRAKNWVKEHFIQLKWPSAPVSAMWKLALYYQKVVKTTITRLKKQSI